MPPTIRSRFAACLPLALAAALVAPVAAAEPLTGRYQARPGAVFACGGLFGECEVLQLEGWVEIETFAIVFPGTPSAVRFLASDLRLRALDDGSVVPFPSPGDLPLAELEVTDGSGNNISFASPPDSEQTVQLDLWGVVDDEAAFESHVLLRGVYDEGCCDRFRYEIGGVIFDWTAPLGEPPALRLADGSACPSNGATAGAAAAWRRRPPSTAAPATSGSSGPTTPSFWSRRSTPASHSAAGGSSPPG